MIRAITSSSDRDHDHACMHHRGPARYGRSRARELERAREPPREPVIQSVIVQLHRT